MDEVITVIIFSIFVFLVLAANVISVIIFCILKRSNVQASFWWQFANIIRFASFVSAQKKKGLTAYRANLLLLSSFWIIFSIMVLLIVIMLGNAIVDTK
jgi:hypothetical protein